MNKEFGYYKFIVECYNASTNATDTEKGIVAAKSYTKATKRIINYYGEALVSLSLYGLEPNSIFLISSTNPLCNEDADAKDQGLFSIEERNMKR